MLRHDSSTSTRSARSSPGLVPTAVRSFRGRSSTLSSTNDWLDEDPIPTPAWTESGRNSMASATFGRNSVSGLRSLTSRFRNPSELTSPQRSRQVTPGTSNGPSQHNSFALSRDTIIVSPREDGETAGKYFARIEKDIPKKSIALLMSRSGDTFTHDVLRSLMRTFKFFEEPMDMSIRRFLWEIALPSEAQQIDRVISAFAERYHECNPHIFDKSGMPSSNSTSQMIHMLTNGEDQAYLAAYSLVILHSDLFNKNNKRKMQRSEYQKNTGGHGIHEEILGYFYDNIQYTEFIAQNADNDDPEAKSKNQARRMKKMRSMIAAGDSGRNPNLDPYDFIIDGSLKLDILRPALKDVLTLEDTFNYRGMIERFDVRALHSSFCRSGILQIVSARSRPDAFTSPTTITNPEDGHPGVVDIKVVKVGLLWRKDVKKKKTRSPWQEWGAVLTPSQLYFFRNTGWVKGLMHQTETHLKQGNRSVSVVFKPPLEEFRPDYGVPTLNGIALLDTSYKKHKNAFCFARQSDLFDEVLLAENEAELNDWIAKLNYAAAFTTANIAVRPLLQPSRKSSRTYVLPVSNGGSPRNGQHLVANGEGFGARLDDTVLPSVGASRRLALKHKISALQPAISRAQVHVEDYLKTGRHLEILAPFPTKTRNELLAVGARLSSNLRWARYELCRLKCLEEILASDLAEEESGQSNILAAEADPKNSNYHSPIAKHQSRMIGVHKPSRPNGSTTHASTTETHQNLGGDEITNRQDPLPPASDRSASANSGPLQLAPISSLDAHSMTSADGRLTAAKPNFLRNNSIASSLSSIEKIESTKVAEHAILPFTSVGEGNGVVKTVAVAPSIISEREGDPAQYESLNRSKVRRSLQRTLRESPLAVPHHQKNKKMRESMSGVGEMAQSSAGLARGEGSFTVHGKKASVVTLGSTWLNMSAEERLELRKQAQHENNPTGAVRVDEDPAQDVDWNHGGSTGTHYMSPTQAGAGSIIAVDYDAFSLSPRRRSDDSDDDYRLTPKAVASPRHPSATPKSGSTRLRFE